MQSWWHVLRTLRMLDAAHTSFRFADNTFLNTKKLTAPILRLLSIFGEDFYDFLAIFLTQLLVSVVFVVTDFCIFCFCALYLFATLHFLL